MAGKIQNQVAEQKAGSVARQTMKMVDFIKAYEGAIKQALPSVITPERFLRMATTALSTTPKLQKCTPGSFIGALLLAAQLGLEPNTPLEQAYLIPYSNKKKRTLPDGSTKWETVDDVQFQIGYKGMIDLAYRSGEVELVQAQVVYSNDKFECEYGLNPKLSHIPADNDRGEPIKVYALFKTKSGGYGFEVMSMEDVRKHAQKYSQSYSSSYSPWTKNFEEMAKKTVLKKVLKYAPVKSDFVRGVVQDESIKTEISDDMFSVPNEAVYDADYQEVTPNDTEGTNTPVSE